MAALNPQLAPRTTGLGGIDVKQAWNDSKKTPIQQIDDYCRDIFSESASARQRIVAGERVVAATLIASMAVVATGGFVIALPLAFVPFLMPLVGAVAGVVVDELNDFLASINIHRSGICDHPELQPKTMDDGTWLHYPGRKYNGKLYGAVPGNPLRGWGALGLDTVTPSLDDYPQIKSLDIEFDVNRRVLKIPSATPGSFLEAWYVVYATIKECNYLQQCSALSSEDADKQEEAAFLTFATLWSRSHSSSSTTTYPAAAAPGDDKTLVKHAAVTINTGKVLPPVSTTVRLPGGAIGATSSASSTSTLTTAAKVAGGTALATAAGIGIYAFVKKQAYSYVAKKLWKNTGGKVVDKIRGR